MTLAEKPIRLEITDHIAYLIFDRPNSSANIFDEPTLQALDATLKDLEKQKGVRGLVISSAKKSIFVAGADLKSLIKKSYDNSLGEFIGFGQTVFNKLADLPFPTVAAIHGAAAGGGYELTLACDWRLAANVPATKIGLPEVTLGLLPAWGGATRLPRLIGAEKAASVILEGKLYSADGALKAGLVDEVVPEGDLITKALEKIKQGKPSRPAVKNSNTEEPAMLKSIPADYPAPRRAWEVISTGLTKDAAASLKLEKKAIVDLAQTETCHNLVRNFFLQDRARKLTFSKDARRVESVGIIGGGVMGTGIAYWLGSNGIKTTVFDSNEQALGKCKEQIESLLQGSVAGGRMAADKAKMVSSAMQYAAKLEELKSCEIIIEAASEKMEVKKEIFKKLGTIVDPKALLATNTSALSVEEIASATSSPERMVGLHFFNPAYKMKLVEVIQAPKTDAAQLARALYFVGQIGRIPVVVTDKPGFIVNRVLFSYLLEAAELYQAGVEFESIENAALQFGMPMGPLRLLDEIGLDISMDIAETLARHFRHYSIPHILRRLIDNGHLGRKKAGGFYRYDAGAPRPNPSAASKDKKLKIKAEEIQLRLLAPMLNEAIRCLDEKVAASPHDVDLAMILGTGFPQHRGGPIRYAEHYGLDKLVAAMNNLASSVHVRFAPCRLLQTKAKSKESFYEDVV